MVNATSGWCSLIARMVGMELPVVTHPLQACVTEPLKPFLKRVIVSANLHVYINQTPRGEVVLGSEIDTYATYCMTFNTPHPRDDCWLIRCYYFLAWLKSAF